MIDATVTTYLFGIIPMPHWLETLYEYGSYYWLFLSFGLIPLVFVFVAIREGVRAFLNRRRWDA
jgi:hypothetical protein